MKKEIINEMDRMRSLFGYKRGVVISEQPDEKFDTSDNKQINRELNAPPPKPATSTSVAPPEASTSIKGSNKSEYPECVQKFGNPKPSQSGKQYSIVGTGDWKDYFFYSNGKYGSFKIGTPPPHGTYSCNNGVIVMGGDTNKPVVLNKPKKPVTIPTPKELKDVKNFQDWLDTNHPGWHKKYKTLNKSVPKGYGIFGPNTSAAWNQYKNEYLTGNKSNSPFNDADDFGGDNKNQQSQQDLLWGSPTDIQGNPTNVPPVRPQ
jgi:hypothetical protein